MADYLTLTVVQNALGTRFVLQHTDDDKDGTPDTDVLAALYKAAESDINIRVNKGYVLPITVVDHGQMAYDAMENLCIGAFKYRCHLRRSTVDEQIANDYEMTLKSAEAMGKGGLAMPGDPPVQRTSPESSQGSHRLMATTSTKPSNRSWTRDETGNM